MKKLVNPDGSISYGLFKTPVDRINYLDFPLKTPMGRRLFRWMKKIKFNQFVFAGIAGPDIIAGVAIIDLKYVANGFAYVLDRKTGVLVEETRLSAFGKNTCITPSPSKPDCVFDSRGLGIRIKDNRLFVNSRKISVDLSFDPSESNPLRLCTRTGFRGWTYTEKTPSIRVEGKVASENGDYLLGYPHMGLFDFSCGYMRRNTFWNWASISATLPDGRTLGMNLACGVNETGFTENAVWIDGKMEKVDVVNFIFDEDDLKKKWVIQSFDGKVDLEFYPEECRKETINKVVVASKFAHFLGSFSGKLTTNSMEEIHIKGCPGWTENHFARW